MAGHSKWANIKHRKGANDAKRAKLYTKLIKEIIIAVKEGGGPELSHNSKLRLAVQNAKGANVPKETIEKAIKKGAGNESTDYITITYEGYGPFGVAIFLECTSDNINRTVSFVRSTFSKYGGGLGKNGSIVHLFDRLGIFIIKTDNINDEDTFTLNMIDAGAIEIEKEENCFYVTCSINNFGNIQKELEKLKIDTQLAEIKYVPNQTITLNDAGAQKIAQLISVFEDNDDVKNVYHNLEILENQVDFFE